jgi:hypothetical protein
MSNLPLSWCNYTTSKKFVSFIFSIGVIPDNLDMKNTAKDQIYINYPPVEKLKVYNAWISYF